MKKYFAILIILFVCLASCKRKQEDIIADVKKKYTEINQKLTDYKPKRVDDLTNSGGGSITGYYREEEVKKVVAEHFTDSTRSFIECYFDDGMLIMIWKQNYVYNRTMSYTEERARANGDSVWYDDKKTKVQTNLFYFNKNKLVKWVNINNADVKPGTAEFIDMESVLWGETAILLKQLKEQ